MKIIGYVCYALAAIDFIAGNFFQIDLTGVWWSPIALGGIGAIVLSIAEKNEGSDENDPDN
jgi:hypothetical protein